MNDLETALDILANRTSHNLSALLNPIQSRALLAHIASLERQLAEARDTIETLACGQWEIGHERTSSGQLNHAIGTAKVENLIKANEAQAYIQRRNCTY
jgi:hypothetical protein